MGNNTLVVTIKKRDGHLINAEEFFALSSLNECGVFDILPQHANFITMVKEKVILHKKDGSKQEIPITNGVLHATNNTVDIYIDILSPQSQIPDLNK